MGGWHVTENDIKNWTATDKRRSEELLPQLIYKLILASCSPRKIDFPFGDSVSTGGWDGELEVDQGNLFVPSGVSAWEFGTDKSVNSKANDDYEKRTKDPEPFDKKKTTYVFVTSRHWKDRSKWEADKNLDEEWGSVKAINARVLCDWLEQCPAVHRWFAQLIGKRCSNLWDIEQSWSKFSNITEISLTDEFFLHNRDELSDRLKDSLLGDPASYTVCAKSINESQGFILSVIFKDASLSSKFLTVLDQSTWDDIASSKSPLILMPINFQPSGVGDAVSNDHIVILPTDESSQQTPLIRLDKRPRLVQQEAIQKLGFNDSQASKLYSDTKGYLEPLLRHEILRPREYIAPKWPAEIDADVLFSALFATEWNLNNDNDKDILSALSGMDYDQLEKQLDRLSTYSDTPIRRVGTVWQVISKIDFWLNIRNLMSMSHIDRLGDICGKVLGDIDPSYNMDPDERWMASVKGNTPKYSGLLKRDIADTLALLSTYSDDHSSQLGGVSVKSKIELWLSKLFKENNTTEFWYSLGRSTSLLAEAAPEVFLDAVDSSSLGESSPLLGLFNSEAEDSFTGGCYHSNLLWALETISWNKNYLTRVCQALARLSEIDPGGRYSNRPFSSLVDIFIGWVTYSSATHDERANLIKEVLLKQYPDVAWRLMRDLLVGNTRMTSGLASPDYQDWAEGVNKSTKQSDYFSYVGKIVDMMIAEADKDPDNRYIDLASNFDSYTVSQREAIIGKLLSVDVDNRSDDSRKKLLQRLRDLISRHREFSDADWAWPDEVVTKLEEVYLHFNFDSPVLNAKYLFDDHWPDLIDPVKRRKVPYEERQAYLDSLRVEKLEELYDESGVDGFKELLESCKFPRLVGFSLYKSKLKDFFIDDLVVWLDQDDSYQECSNGYFSAMTHSDFAGAKKILSEHPLIDAYIKSQMLVNFPVIKETFDILEKCDISVQESYWHRIEYYFVQDKDSSLVEYISRNLLRNGRPVAAVDAFAQSLHRGASAGDMDAKLAHQILIKIATNPEDIDRIPIESVSHDITQAIKFIQDSGQCSDEEVLQIEWLYAKAFRHHDFSPTFIHKSITKDPSNFIQLIKWVFVRKDGVEEEEAMPEEQAKQVASAAWNILDTLHLLPEDDFIEEWVSVAREQLIECGRLEIGDLYIGKYLSKCRPDEEDGIWPKNSVRGIIETLKSESFEDGIINGKLNSRGVTTRHPYAGGEQERKLAEGYQKDSESVQLIYPRTAKILRGLAEHYRSDANYHDQTVDLN
ncbi:MULTISPECIES: hypothetical protein [unclassified Microbulbifer]|uniref:hypothetical protein n=1 Tax=unclassified Microbulbifer TaxID=2619833 RepID=UPI0027E4B026|nr:MULTISPECIES: hypothetical protein [unclassified Microbulbifer]